MTRSWGHRVGLIVAASLVVAAGMAPAVPSSAAGSSKPSTGVTWSPPHTALVLNRQGFEALSCPTTTFCVATNRPGTAVVYRNGAWSTPHIVPPLNHKAIIASVSCPTTTFCAAVASGAGRHQLVVRRGGSWHSAGLAAVKSPPLVAVSCATATYCVALDTESGYYIYDGKTLSHRRRVGPNGRNQEISCPTVDFCAAAGFHGHSATFNGKRWVTERIGGGADVFRLSCAARRSCLAISDHGVYALGEHRDWRTITPAGLQPGEPDQANAVSCATASHCVVIGDDFPTNAYTLDHGAWAAPVRLGHQIRVTNLACPSTITCISTSFDGTTATLHHGAWSKSAIRISAHQGPLASLSCSSAARCVAVEQSRGTIDLRGRRWHRTSGEGQIRSPDDLSCPTGGTCFAIDSSGGVTERSGDVWGSRTQVVRPSFNDRISCVSVMFCMALSSGGPGGDNAPETAVWDGSAWSDAEPLTGATAATTLSCPAPGNCTVLTDTDGSVNAAHYVDGAWTSQFITKNHGSLTTLSCQTTGFCAAGGNHGDVEIFNGSTWLRDRHAVGHAKVVALSCGSAGRCVGINALSRSTALVGTTWHPAPAFRNLAKTADSQPILSCPTANRCVAVFATKRADVAYYAAITPSAPAR